jgi:hypothetical protein
MLGKVARKRLDRAAQAGTLQQLADRLLAFLAIRENA